MARTLAELPKGRVAFHVGVLEEILEERAVSSLTGVSSGGQTQDEQFPLAPSRLLNQCPKSISNWRSRFLCEQYFI